MLSNEAVGIGGSGISGSCKCRVRFQTLLQATSIVFFLRLLNILCLRTLTQNKQLYNQPIFNMHIRWFRLFIPSLIFIEWFDSFQGGAIKGKRTYPLFSLSPLLLNLSKPFLFSSLRKSNHWHIEPLDSVLSLLLSLNYWHLSIASILYTQLATNTGIAKLTR